MPPNGLAIKGGCVTRRKHRAGSWYFSQKAVTVQGGYGALFAVQVQVLWAIRVSRYKLSRNHKFITVQVFNFVQMRVSGCNGHYEFV